MSKLSQKGLLIPNLNLKEGSIRLFSNGTYPNFSHTPILAARGQNRHLVIVFNTSHPKRNINASNVYIY
jgi:hypothetical protein